VEFDSKFLPFGLDLVAFGRENCGFMKMMIDDGTWLLC